MQMLKKIFSSDNKYYLELKEEVQDSEVVQTAVETAEKTAAAVKEKAQEVAKSEPVQSAVKTAGEAVDAAQAKAASAIATDEPSKKSAEVAPSKAQKNGKAKQNNQAAAPKEIAKKEESKAEATPANSGASSFEPPFWVAAMNNTNKAAANGNAPAAEPTFATDNLMPTITKYRRRPGGSLDKFKDMAKSAKTPK